MAAERRLFEEARHELVISYFEDVLQSQCTTTLVTSDTAER